MFLGSDSGMRVVETSACCCVATAHASVDGMAMVGGLAGCPTIPHPPSRTTLSPANLCSMHNNNKLYYGNVQLFFTIFIF